MKRNEIYETVINRNAATPQENQSAELIISKLRGNIGWTMVITF